MLYHKELKVALNAVQNASELCRKVQKILVDVKAIEKNDRSPVTIADFGSQAVINLDLGRAFPGDPIVAEEDAGLLKKNPEIFRQVADLVNDQAYPAPDSDIMVAIASGSGETDFAGRFWTLDPIDGTKGFLRGEQYAVALALVENGEVVLGVLGCPNFQPDMKEEDGCLFYAVRGEGAFMKVSEKDEKKPLSVDSVTNGKEARFCESVESTHASHEDHARISTALGITTEPYRLDSQAKYAAVGCGKASLYLRLPRTESYREKIWDHAAGSIIVREAGGEVTDFRGKPLDFSTGRKLEKNRGILASNGHLHQAALRAISELIRDS